MSLVRISEVVTSANLPSCHLFYSIFGELSLVLTYGFTKY